jgi:hypothetical protein
MSAIIFILPTVARTGHRQASRGAPCARCDGLRFVHFGRMNEAQRRWAPAEAVLPCPDCLGGAEVIPFEPASQP